jgi:hypothetical protein
MSKLIEDPELRYGVTLPLCPADLHKLLHIAGSPMDLETVRTIPVMIAADPAFAQELQATAQAGLWRAISAYDADDHAMPVGEMDSCGDLAFLRLPYPKIGKKGARIGGKATGTLGTVRNSDQ